MKINVEVYDGDEDSASGLIQIETGVDEQGTVMLHLRANADHARPISAVLDRFTLGVLVGALRQA